MSIIAILRVGPVGSGVNFFASVGAGRQVLVKVCCRGGGGFLPRRSCMSAGCCHEESPEDVRVW